MAPFLPRAYRALSRLLQQQRSPLDPYRTLIIYINALRMHRRLRHSEDPVRLGLNLGVVGLPYAGPDDVLRLLSTLPLPTEAMRRNRCWVFSLVAFHYLRQSGDPVWGGVNFVLGTRKHGERVQFHAWLERDGERCFDLDSGGGYTPIFSSKAA